MVDFTVAHEKAITKAHERIDTIQQLSFELKIMNNNQKEQADRAIDLFREHIKKDELAFNSLTNKIEEIARYKWISLGIIGTLIILSGSGSSQIILKLLGV